MHPRWLPFAICTACVLIACGKSDEQRARERAEQDTAAARAFSADKAASARELEEARLRRKEIAAAHQEDIHKESEETFRKFVTDRPALNEAAEAKMQQDEVEKLRARMTDPAAMQVRNVRLNPARNAICLEVNYREKGTYLGFRKAYITPDITWVEPAADDVTHRVFELNLEKIGCNAPPAK
ncbi:MAG: hypothetical protein ABI981_06260 [Betaproteobacteria bacterium]